MNLSDILYNVVLSPITQIIEISYRLFSKLFSNTGIAVLGVSLTVTLLCLPLYIVAESWEEEERNIQARLKGGIARIKKFFTGDEQYMILSTYYRQNHYHPIMALRSSFGILIQIPFFLAAYHTLSSLPDLQGKSFLFIRDMGKPDSIFTVHGFAVNILPIAMTIINCISGAIYSKGHGFREKAQIYGMALIFLVILYNSPAGLVVYWTMNNLFSLVKNIFYKMKNPLKVFYLCVVTFILVVAFYILFVYSGGAAMSKRIPAALFLLFWIPVPLYIKGINTLISRPLNALYSEKKVRTSIFLFSALSLTILTGLVLPSGLISSSVQEFSNIDSYGNPTEFLHSSFWMSFGLFISWPTCVYFLFKEKLQTILSFGFSAILLCAVVNAYVFSGNYGSMDETLRFIDGFKNPSFIFMTVNLAIIFLITVLTVIIIKFKKAALLSNIFMISASAFTVITIINTTKINKAYNEFQGIMQSKQETVKSSGTIKFSLSKNEKNVMVFMLDRFASAYVMQILEDKPELKEQLTGFTFYPNCISFNGHTLMGAPALYGGYDYTPFEMNKRKDVKLKEKHNEALLVMPKILTEQAGFHAYLSDLSWANYSYISDMSFAKDIPEVDAMSLLGKYTADFMAEQLLPGNEKFSLSHIMNRNLFWVSLFREAPSPVRPVIYYKGTWWENGIKEAGSSFAEWFSILYSMDKITDFTSSKPTLSVITNEATHSNEEISMYGILPEKLKGSGNAYKIDFVCLDQIGKFCNFLRENDAYDNTRIILVSDHGIGNRMHERFTTPSLESGYSKDHFNPVLLVKDFNSNSAFKVDGKFMTNADVPSIAFTDIIEKPVNPFTGNEISESPKDAGVIVTEDNLFMPHQSKSKDIFTVKDSSWYTVKDDLFVDSNWSKLYQ
ncbi:MAG: YidC/Oxa1 family membrane protein insertase [Treponema sp.]|nr:YidC/Oxa1 family membrane protein insertase [Treponema sp.]